MARVEHRTPNEVQLERVERKLDELCRWVNGNDGHPGAKVRFDRLERHAAGIKWFLALGTTLLLGNLLTAWVRG